MMKKLIFALLAVVAIVACDKGDDTPKSIELTGGTTTNQTIYADETSKSDGIKFKATEAWTANVTAVTGKAGGSEVDWLTLNMYEGGAGEFTLTMSMQTNTSGSDRKAQIRIVSGETIVTIIVEQKGTKEDGTVPEQPKLITKIEVDQTYPLSEEPTSKVFTFNYDVQNRISAVKMVLKNVSEDKYYKKYDWTYNTGNTVMTQEDFELGGAGSQYLDNSVQTFLFNADGTVKSMNGERISKMDGREGYRSEYTNTLTYNNGYLSGQTFYQKNWWQGNPQPDDNGLTRFEWENGNLITMYNGSDVDDWYVKSEYGSRTFGENPVRYLSGLLMFGGPEDFSTMGVNIGKMSKNLVSKNTFKGAETSETPEGDPQVTVIYRYTDFEYIFDENDNITKLKTTETFSNDNRRTVLEYKITYNK